MNRRSFLASLAALSATAAYDPERLLWVPGQKTFFLPAPARATPWLLVNCDGTLPRSDINLLVKAGERVYWETRVRNGRPECRIVAAEPPAGESHWSVSGTVRHMQVTMSPLSRNIWV